MTPQRRSGQRRSRPALPDGRDGSPVLAWSVTSRPPHRFDPRSLPEPGGPRLHRALAREHVRRPFQPSLVRDAAQRVASIARTLELDAVVVRGGLDVGGAELDHVWTVVDECVVDVSLPVRSEVFVVALRAYIAGDLDDDSLDRLADEEPIDRRVLGEFPPRLRYVGLPVFGAR